MLSLACQISSKNINNVDDSCPIIIYVEIKRVHSGGNNLIKIPSTWIYSLDCILAGDFIVCTGPGIWSQVCDPKIEQEFYGSVEVKLN